MNTRSAFLLISLLILLPACSNDDDGLATPIVEPAEVVTGEVTAIDDQTPVDGGITFDLQLGGQVSDQAYFLGLFRPIEPAPEELDLYDLVRRVEIGDRVRVEGTRIEGVLRIDSLWILQGKN